MKKRKKRGERKKIKSGRKVNEFCLVIDSVSGGDSTVR